MDFVILILSFGAFLGNALIYQNFTSRFKPSPRRNRINKSAVTRLFWVWKKVIRIVIPIYLIYYFIEPIAPPPFAIRLCLVSLLPAIGMVILYKSLQHLGQEFSCCSNSLQPSKRVVSGPYKYMNHPIYFSNSLTFIGLALANLSWFSVAILIIQLAIYVSAALDESKNLDKRFPLEAEPYGR